MKLTIKNIALDKFFADNNISSINELNNDQLQQACMDLRILPVVTLADEDSKPYFNSLATVESILKSFEYSIYVSETYWRPEHKRLIEERKAMDTLAKHTKGDDTFKTLELLGLGFFGLRPGMEKTIDVPEAWVNEEFRKHPMCNFLDIRDENGNKIEMIKPITKEAPKASTGALSADAKAIMLEMSLESLKKVVSEKVGYKVPNKDKEELIQMYEESMASV